MKALVKIAPIVVIIACAASLFFAFRLSGQKKGLQEDLASKTSELDQTRAKLGQTQSELATTAGQLKQTQNDLAAAKANLEAKDIELGQRRREIEATGAVVLTQPGVVARADRLVADTGLERTRLSGNVRVTTTE